MGKVNSGNVGSGKTRGPFHSMKNHIWSESGAAIADFKSKAKGATRVAIGRRGKK